MKTRNVDLAAYLHLAGIAPTKIVWLPLERLREFHYQHTPILAAACKAFEEGAVVPAKAYAEARVVMKSTEHDRMLGNHRRAVNRATFEGQFRPDRRE